MSSFHARGHSLLQEKNSCLRGAVLFSLRCAKNDACFRRTAAYSGLCPQNVALSSAWKSSSSWRQEDEGRSCFLLPA